MKILIIGAGAIGSLLAYRLAATGQQVTTLGRAPYIRAVTQRGLLIDENGQVTRAPQFQAVDNIEALGDAGFDLVLVTTKAYDTAVAAVQAQPFVRRGAATIVMQNGVGGVDVARGLLRQRDLYAGVITVPVEVLKPAVIRLRTTGGGIGLAAVAADGDPGPLVELFAQAGFDVRSYEDWQGMKWSKLMLNLLANAIPAILDWPLERVYANRRLYALERDALREARSVVRQMKLKLVSLPGYRVPLLVWTLCALPSLLTYPLFRRAVLHGRGGKSPSLHMDLSRGRLKSEVVFLNGAVARAGAKVGVATPINRVLCETLIGIARGEIDWFEHQGQADRLIRRARTGGLPD